MTRMTETKSVKVDNWGVFFLQKLQNFFNKTDHCDLTLQFNDNSQLKVHRLVLSACTDYFNMLESTCEMYDDVLIMPLDLQADVIVPIVNFMYTGTLEFQYNMYEKLLKTARDMNMTVLLKLLEAHKQTTRFVQSGRQPIVLNKQAPTRAPYGRSGNVTLQMPPAMARSYSAVRHNAPLRPTAPIQKPHQIVKNPASIPSYSANKSMSVPEPHTLVAKYGALKEGKTGPSRFEEASVSETFEGSFDDISYESKPLVTADQIKKEEETSPFEKLRKGYTNINVVKRPAPSSFSTPVAKKPNLEEVKEFTEAARLRSQMVTEEEDSPGCADDTRFDDDDEEEAQAAVKQLPTKISPGMPKQIVIKQEPKTSPNAGGVKQITVKDESGSVDHAKIISEVLKKYPHLVKKNKNIKLKIMQKTSPSAQSGSSNAQQNAPIKMEVRTATPLKSDISMVRKATEAVRQPATTAPPSTAPKKIDSKTMHALIAKGAENMTGPWLCLRCGIDGRPISIPSYKAFRNHLIVKHKEKIDARICEHCGWKAEQRNPHLFYHWLTEHSIKSTIKFPTCSECGHVAMNLSNLQRHEEENHQRGDLQQCIYCNKVFAKEMDLYEHMKSLHKERAREDGVIDFSDDEYHVDDEEEEIPSQNTSQENRIKILSNISITNNSGLPFVIDPSQAQTVSQIGGKSQIQLQQITLEPSSEAEALSNVASGIATSLGLVDNTGVVIEDPNFQGQYIEHQLATVHGETATTTTITATGPDQLTKLITADGTELQLTQSQKEEIFSQLQNSGNGGNVVMVLNDANFISGTGLQLEDGTQLIGTPAPTGQDSNIVVMYTQAGEEVPTPSTITTTNATMLIPSSTSAEQVVVPEETMKASTEDETSQASTQPSEKATSEKEAEQESVPMEVDAECSQGMPAERSVETGAKEADLSADLSESSEVAQQIDQQEKEEADDEEEEEEDETTAKEDDTKAAKEREKLKLISELEGDWSEDTDEQQPQAEAKENADDQPENTSEEPKTDDKTKIGTDEPKKVTAEGKTEGNDKEVINELLDEWNNETKFTESDSDADLEKKLGKVVGEKKVDTTEETAMETSTADNTAGSVDDSMNNSETHVVVMAAESDNEASIKEEDTSATQHEESAEKSSLKEESAEQDESKNENEKAKSKEVVSSLLGDWDEDDDL